MSQFNQRQPALRSLERSELPEASMWVVAARLRVSELVALKVTADVIGRFVQFFQTHLAPLPR
jgi:hypothetical protein